MRDTGDGFRSRRSFLADLAAGAGAAALLGGGCETFDFWEDIAVGTDKVTDRFHQSMAGHAKELVFPEADSDEFSFLWLSDIHIQAGRGHWMKELGAFADQVGARFVLHSGDAVDKGNDQNFQLFTTVVDREIPVPFFNAIGNHDLYSKGWDLYKLYVGPSVYRFEYATCEFIFIDDAAGTLGKDQMDWLEDVLSHISVPNRFVLGHYPIYDGSLQTPSSMGNNEERMKMISMFQKLNVKYFLCGHKHTGAQYHLRHTTYLISGAGSTYKLILQDEPHFYLFDVRGDEVMKHKIYFEDIRS